MHLPKFFKAKVARVSIITFSNVSFATFAGSKSCTIRKLNLSNNSIGYQGANHIAEVLASAETLEELNLSGMLLCLDTRVSMII